MSTAHFCRYHEMDADVQKAAQTDMSTSFENVTSIAWSLSLALMAWYQSSPETMLCVMNRIWMTAQSPIMISATLSKRAVAAQLDAFFPAFHGRV